MARTDAPPPRRRVLVIDDEDGLRHMLGIVLERGGYEVVGAADGEEGLEALRADPEVSLVLCDVRMPRLDGLALLARLGELGRPVHVIVMSAYGSMELALEAMKRGAYDYISKPFKPDEVLLVLRKLEERERLALENERLREAVRASQPVQGFIGCSRAVQELLDTVRRVAAYPTTVLITGESGTGKELLARAIHDLSDRSARPFVGVNCGAIPEGLLESELFGHERGAFTGAVRSRPGLFEQAAGGTLLLDELGELPPSLQVKLLRVLEERTVRRVGGSRLVRVDARVVAATSRDLQREVAAGTFREDLMYRLNVVHLHIPALRERPEDVPLLVEHFVARHGRRFGREVRRIEPAALDALARAPWPGNVRQLENAIERAVILCKDGVLRPGDLPPDLMERREGPAAPEQPEDLSIKRRTASLERDLIVKALARTGGNRTQAARLLELSYKTLLYKVKGYGLEEA